MKLTSGLLLLLFISGCAEKEKKATQPNIIYILADDLGYGDLGCYGQEIIKTPNIDKLAEQGILFTDHYAGSSVCAPSRAALITGFHTGHNRVRGNYEVGPLGFGACLELREQDVTIAEVLKPLGYTSAVIGKWGLGMNGTTGEPNKQGFDYSYGFLNQGHAHFQFPSFVFRNGERLEIPENKNLANKRFSNDLFTEEALRFVGVDHEAPFFLYLAYTTPHAEMLLPESDIFDGYKGIVAERPYVKKGQSDSTDNNKGAYRSQEFPAAAYAAQISHLDSCVGVLVKRVADLGLSEETVFMFSSDNGPHAEGGANPACFKSAGKLRGQKRDLYEGGVRVPFIVKWEGKIEPKSVSDEPSAFWDIFSTMESLAGSLEPSKNDGLSLLPTLMGQNQQAHDYLYWEFHENPSTNQAIRKGNWKAVRHDPKGEIELYDLSSDLSESTDLASEFPEKVAEMAVLFTQARTEHEIWALKSKR
ncbi:MAG: arylsulfatase A [Arcticibacterium sp.]|jgi:arylsulfatase A